MEWIAESLESIVRGGGQAEWSTGGNEVEEGFGEKQDGDGAKRSEEQPGFFTIESDQMWIKFLNLLLRR